MYSTPGPRKGNGLPPGPTSLRGVAETRRPQGSTALHAAGLLPKDSAVQKRIRTPTWALGGRRLGLQEEGRASVLVGGGVSALPPPFSQRMIATAHGRAWRRISHVTSSRGERGFFPPKTPPLPFRVALGRLLGLLKGGQDNQGRQDRSQARHKQEGRKTGSAPSRKL